MKQYLPLEELYTQANLFNNFDDFKAFILKEYDISIMPQVVDDLIDNIYSINGIGFYKMSSKSKKVATADARFIYYYIMKNYLGFEPTQIAEFINKGASSVLMSLKQHNIELIDRIGGLKMYKPVLEEYKQLKNK